MMIALSMWDPPSWWLIFLVSKETSWAWQVGHTLHPHYIFLHFLGLRSGPHIALTLDIPSLSGMVGHIYIALTLDVPSLFFWLVWWAIFWTPFRWDSMKPLRHARAGHPPYWLILSDNNPLGPFLWGPITFSLSNQAQKLVKMWFTER